jgi:hypothetical protein
MKTKRIPIHILPGLLWLAGQSFFGQANAAVSVYGVATSTGEYVTTEVYADISVQPIVSHSFKVFYDPKLLQVVSAYHNDEVWYLSDGKNKIPYGAPEMSERGEVLFVGGRLDAREPLAGVEGRRVLLGTVVFSRRDRQTPRFSASIGRPGQFASFVTTKGEVLEAAQGEVSFGEILATQDDQDLDGLEDAWEIEYFKDLEGGYYADDSDQDGVDNGDEASLGSDPTDPNSNLRLVIARDTDGVTLAWDSFEGRVYTLEAAETPGDFRPLATGLKAAPPRNVYELELSPNQGAMFYRVMLEPASQR